MVSRDVKVGLFVLMGLTMIGLSVFLIGDERSLFSKHELIRAAFKDVQGLSKGSPVRMGGVDIGRVVDLGYGAEERDDTIFVRMEVVADEARRIRENSVASVEGKGFLGDKMVVITVGDPNLPRIPAGALIPSEESRDIAAMISDLRKAAAGADRVIANLEKTTSALADKDLHKNIKEGMENLAGVLASLNSNQGYLGRLINDPKESKNISTTVSSLRRSAGELQGLLSATKRVMSRVETGPGFIHEVIYDSSGSRALAQIGGAAEEIGASLADLRQGNSLAHEVLYGEDSGKIVKNLEEASSDIALIVDGLRQGKGTLGAFLVDPSVYDDIKVLLGNVGRNRSLKALVRYSIARDEKAGRVIDPEPSPEVAKGSSKPAAQLKSSKKSPATVTSSQGAQGQTKAFKAPEPPSKAGRAQLSTPLD
ncbi:MAG: MlaD family protein [Polyangiaceae bacterium]|nr:MlaD family protein [Polyangiaceae bacterium]